MRKPPITGYWLLIFFLVIQRIPVIVENNTLSTLLSIAVLLPFWYLIIKKLAIPTSNSGRIIRNVRLDVLWVYIVFIFLIIVALMRGLEAGSLGIYFFLKHLVWWTTIFLFSVALFLTPRSRDHVIILRRGIYYSLFIYVGFNVLLHAIGVEPGKEIVVWDSFGRATILSLLGLELNRAVFPLASGISSFAFTSGIVTLISAMLLIDKSKKCSALVLFGMLFLGSYALLRSDSRAAILWIVFTPFVVWLGVGKIKGLIRFLPIAILVLPIALISAASFVAKTQQSSPIARQAGADNISTLSSRSIVWGNVLDELYDFKLKHILGYGARGQVASGLGAANYDVFSTDYRSNPEQKSLHNVLFQYIIDMGYLGLIVFIVLMMRVIKAISRMSIKEDGKLHMCFIVYVLLGGTTVAVPTIYGSEIFSALILLITSLLRRDGPVHSQPNRSRGPLP